MEGSKAPSGGFGSYYSAILVPRHHYRIDKDGNHLNVPEPPVNEATSSVVSVKATTTEQPVKQATTRAKKTT